MRDFGYETMSVTPPRKIKNDSTSLEGFTSGVFNLLSSRASFFNPYIASPTSQLILQPFRRFTYVTAHSTALPLLHLRHRHFTYVTWRAAHTSFSNLYIASPTLQLIFLPFRRFTYVTAHSTTLPPLHLRHMSFYNPSVASPTSQALHVLHLANRPCIEG